MNFIIWLIVGGVIAAFIGVLIGMPALRVSGLYLALVTLIIKGIVEWKTHEDRPAARAS